MGWWAGVFGRRRAVERKLLPRGSRRDEPAEEALGPVERCAVDIVPESGAAPPALTRPEGVKKRAEAQIVPAAAVPPARAAEPVLEVAATPRMEPAGENATPSEELTVEVVWTPLDDGANAGDERAATEVSASVPVAKSPVPERLPGPGALDILRQQRASYFSPAGYVAVASAPGLLAPDLPLRMRTDEIARLPEPERRPAAAVTVIAETTAQPRLLEELATAPRGASRALVPGVVSSVDPLLLTLYLSSREGGPELPADATEEYLSDGALAARGAELRDRVLRHAAEGGAPLSLMEFRRLAVELAVHAGTALLLCHNVAKAFARGGGAIRWRNVNRARGEYHDGRTTWTAAALHCDARLRTDPFASPSIFYALFSAAALGTGDPGDWYRCFGAAAIAWYAASGKSRLPAAPAPPAAERIAAPLREIYRVIHPERDVPSDAQVGWRWANAWSFLEGATAGRAQQRVRGASEAQLRGAVLGLAEARQRPGLAWRWLVPLAGKGVPELFAKGMTDLPLTPNEAIAVT